MKKKLTKRFNKQNIITKELIIKELRMLIKIKDNKLKKILKTNKIIKINKLETKNIIRNK